MSLELPKQVEQAGKRAEHLMKGDDPEETPQDPKPSTPDEGDLQKQLADLDHKYKTLKGKYDKEVKGANSQTLQNLQNEINTLRMQNKQLSETLASNQDLIKELNAKLETPTQPANEDLDVSTLLDKEDLEHLESEDLGGKTLSVLGKLFRKLGAGNLEPQLRDLSTQVEKMTKQIDETKQSNAMTQIKAVIPDFESVNLDPKFHEWLKGPVAEGSTLTRQDDLQAALSNGDYQSLKAGIDRFKAETGWGQTGEKTKPKPKDDGLPEEPSESFESEPVKPGKTYTRAQINKFYTDQTKGVYKGREKEAAAIDRDIVKAMNEGRITE